MESGLEGYGTESKVRGSTRYYSLRFNLMEVIKCQIKPPINLIE